MLSSVSLAALATLLRVASAQDLAYCDGLRSPNWDSCQALREGLGIRTDNNDKVGFSADDPDNCDGKCVTWSVGDCAIGWCHRDGTCGTVVGDTYANVNTWYTIVETACYKDPLGGPSGPGGAGGTSPGNERYGTYVWNSFDYGFPEWGTMRTLPNGIHEQVFDREEFLELYNNATAGVSAERRRSQGEQVETRDDHQKRQDDVEIIVAHFNTPKGERRVQASKVINPGVTENWNFGEEVTFGVEMSISMSASLFEAFTMEASISVSMEHTTSVEYGVEYSSGNCPDKAVVYWIPYYDVYWVKHPDGEENEIWIPAELGGHAAGEFLTECLGGGT